MTAEPGADRVEWILAWAEHDDGARLVWAGPATDTPRAVLARVAPEDWATDAVRVSATLADHHVHGGDGVDLATSSTEETRTWLAARRRAGVGAVLASLPALGPAELAAALERLRPLWAEGLLAGVHLEGPFLAPARAGAHRPALLCAPDSPAGRAVREVVRAQPTGLVRTVTLAPEVAGSAALERELAAAGVVLCLGHTDVDLPGARAALDRWSALAGPGTPRPVVTHLFNAMRPVHHRAPGPVPVLLDAARRGRLRLELVADDVHVDPGLVDLLLGDPGLAPALCLVSDAVAATGASPGSAHRLGPCVVHAAPDAPRLGPPAPAKAGPAGESGGEEVPAPLAGGCRTLEASVGALLRRGLDPDAVLRAAVHAPRESLGATADAHGAGMLVWDSVGGVRVIGPAQS